MPPYDHDVEEDEVSEDGLSCDLTALSGSAGPDASACFGS